MAKHQGNILVGRYSLHWSRVHLKCSVHHSLQRPGPSQCNYIDMYAVTEVSFEDQGSLHSDVTWYQFYRLTIMCDMTAPWTVVRPLSSVCLSVFCSWLWCIWFILIMVPRRKFFLRTRRPTRTCRGCWRGRVTRKCWDRPGPGTHSLRLITTCL